MSGHTPTPWTIGPDDWQPWPGAIQIVGADGYVVAYTASGGPEKENAELLIKAASNHEALVKALEAASEYLESDAADGFRPAHHLRAEIDTAICNARVGRTPESR